MIGITMGDPAGVGPEIILKAVADMTPEDRAATRVFGNLATLQAVAALIGSPVVPGTDVAVTDLPIDGAPLPMGQPDPRAGDAAFRFIESAVRAAEAGEIGCIVTAPINKATLNAAGHHYDGHTGMLAALTGQKGAFMLLASERLKVIHTSTHVSLQDAIRRTTPERIRDTVRAYGGAFDLVVANYHDQGHIPIKLVAFDTAVNVSIGLPIDRTSVDHGTAFDIAGKGIANHENMAHAIAYARRLAAGRTA